LNKKLTCFVNNSLVSTILIHFINIFGAKIQTATLPDSEKFGNPGNRSYFCRPKIVEFMANHKATKKDVRQAEKRRDRNRFYGKTTRNAIRDLRAVKEQKAAGEQLPEVASMIDKLAKKGVIHKNKAANLKSKLARKVNTLAPAGK
jgi:small subunit ribosomal protein S20